MNQDNARVLQHLTTLAPGDRLTYLRSIGAPGGLILQLVETPDCRPINEPGRALANTVMLTELADELDDPPARARCRRAQAQALAYGSRLDDALAVLDAALPIAESNELTIEAARLRLTRMHALARLARYEEAVADGETARHVFVALNEPALAARADINLGQTRRMSDDPLGALEHFDRARPLLLEEPLIVAQLDNNRAQALQDLSRFGDAEAAYAEALEAFRSLGMAQAVAIAEGNLGDVLNLQGRLAGALLHFERARRDMNRQESPGELARIEAEQAEAFAGAGLHEEAIETWAVAIPDLGAAGLPAELGRAQLGLAATHLQLGRFEDADAALDAAEATYRRIGVGSGAARALTLKGRLALLRGNPGRARTVLAAALQQFAEDSADAVDARLALARAELRCGHPDKTEPLITTALRQARKGGLARQHIEALDARAEMHLAAGRLDDAVDDLREACKLIERQRGRFQADRTRAAFLGGYRRIFDRLIEVLLERGQGASAFAVVEQARSRSLLDLMNGAIDVVDALRGTAPDTEDAALLEEIVGLQGQINALHAQPGLQRRRGGIDLDGLERRLQVQETRLAATRLGGGLFAPPVDGAAVQRVLGPRQVLIEYARTGDELAAFAVRGDGIDVVADLATIDEIAERVSAFQFQISRGLMRLATGSDVESALTDAARAELRTLYRVLLEPLEPMMADASEIVIVPYGPLHALPFPALHDGEGYLLEKLAVSHAPSAGLYCHLCDRPAAATRGHDVLVAVPDEQAPRIADEAATVAAAMRDAIRLEGAEATAAGLRGAVAGASRVHIACHGQFVPTSPASSGLRLADGWLRVREICGLPLSGATVVLSGCETGGIRVDSGDELLGLPRAFFTAGASCLIMSLWRVEDESTRQLMDKHYGLWENAAATPSRSASAAFREAQRSLMRDRPHPVYWSPFVLVGKG